MCIGSNDPPYTPIRMTDAGGGGGSGGGGIGHWAYDMHELHSNDEMQEQRERE
jgi:hypothetical protein